MAITTQTRYNAALYTRDNTCTYTRTDFPGTRFVHADAHTKGNSWYNADRRDSQNDSDWKAKLAKGVDVGHTYTRWQVMKSTPAYWSARCHGYPVVGRKDITYDSTAVGIESFPPLDNRGVYWDGSTDLALRDIALARLKRKLSSHTSQMNALIPLVELRELRGCIVTSVTSLAMLVNHLVDIKRTRGKSAGRWAADMWLNWSFAIKPTLSDLQSAAEALDSAILGQSGVRAYTEYGMSKKFWESSLKTTPGVCYGADITSTHTLYHELSYRYEATATPKVFSANDYSAAKNSGFEMGAILPAMWELTAYSWLFDYFSTVGAWLDDTFITQPYSTKFITLNTRYRCYIWTDVDARLQAITESCDFKVRPGVQKLVQFYRQPLTNLPARALRFKTVDEIGKSGINKVLNLAGVLIGQRPRSSDWHYDINSAFFAKRAKH